MGPTEKPAITPEMRHQRQTFKLIYLPLILICILVITIAIFILLKSGTDRSITQTWSAIGVIFMIMPVLILSIFTITVMILAIIGMSKANQALPPHLRSFRQKIIQVNQKAQIVTNKTTEPIIKSRSFFNAVKTLFPASIRFIRNWRKS